SLSLTLKPSDTFTITPMVIYQERTSNGLQIADNDINNDVQRRPFNVPEGVKDEWAFSALTMKYGPTFGSFISSTSYLNRNSLDNEDATPQLAHDFGLDPPIPSPVPTYSNLRTFTQDLRYVSELQGPLQFVAGGFYQDTTQRNGQFEYAPGINDLFGGVLG